MVNVGAKPVTPRRAVAAGRVTLLASTLQMITNKSVSKGDVFEVARLAGIMAAKRTPELIPLCHSLGLDSVDIGFEILDPTTIEIRATVTVESKTGVEMEAMTAVSVTALTIYDMCKAVDRGISLGPIYLVEKSGGKSGHFRRSESSEPSS